MNFFFFFPHTQLNACTECTRLIPKLRRPQISSGFSDRVLQHIMEKVALTEPLLEFMCLKLPDPNEPKPYNADFIFLRTILPVTASLPVITCLVSWGAIILEEDIIAAGIYIKNDRAMVLNYILNNCMIRSNEIFQTVINTACSEALKAKRPLCVVMLMNHGAAPHPDELLRLPGILDYPVVRHYFQILNSVKATTVQVESMTEPGDDVGTKMKVKKLPVCVLCYMFEYIIHCHHVKL